MLNKIKKIKINPSIIVIMVLVLILICALVLFFEFSNYKNLRSEKHNFYYYFSTDRIDFEGEIVINDNENIISLSNDNLTFTSTPVYYIEYDKQMILPANMEIVYPYKNKPMYKVGDFSKIYYSNNNVYINSEVGTGRIYDCFLYDGEDLYVFIEPTTVVVGKDTYKLSPMSFIEVTNGYIKIYDLKNDKYVFLENYNGIVEAYTEEYFINLSHDTFTYNTSYYMLIKNVERLNYFEI